MNSLTATAPQRQLWVWYSPFGLGGVETYLMHMARAAVSHGVEIGLAAVRTADGPLRDVHERAGVRLFDWSAFYPAYMGQQSPSTAREQMIADLADFRPTLLALNDCADFALGAAPLLRRLRPFCTVLDTFHIDGPDQGYLRRRRPFL